MNWQTLDLNLLRTLDALLAETSTVRAAARIGRSQPAVSTQLARLRVLLGDPLFVRQGNALRPTAYADTLRGPLRDALAGIERALADGTTFDPGRSQRRFRILGDDYLADLILPGLVRTLAAEAPGIRIEMTGPRAIGDPLADGSIDLAFDRGDRPVPEWADSSLAFHALPVTVVAGTNSRLKVARLVDGQAMPLRLYRAFRHVAFSPGGDFRPLEDVALAALGHKRMVAVTLDSFLGMCRLVAASELIADVPGPMAAAVGGLLGLKAFRPPVAVGPVPINFIWHRRHTRDPEHQWLREQLAALLKPHDAAGLARRPRGRP